MIWSESMRAILACSQMQGASSELVGVDGKDILVEGRNQYQ